MSRGVHPSFTFFMEAVVVAHVAVPTRCTAAAGVWVTFLLHCRKFKGAIRMPNVGYGTNKKDRHVLPNGFKKVRGHRGPDVACLHAGRGARDRANCEALMPGQAGWYDRVTARGAGGWGPQAGTEGRSRS